jgi:predicted transcriptional regulator of viral defense system
MTPPGPETRLYGTQPDHVPAGARRERAIHELAARQHGVVSLSQLRSLGLGPSGVRRRAATGKLRRLHRGVYAIGLGRASVQATYMAAVLACGPNAALSHRSAAAHLGLRPCNRSKVDVTVPGRTGKERKGIDVHRAAGLEERDVTEVDGIPCTSVARTLLDLAEAIDRTALERAIEQAEKLGMFDLTAVVDVTSRAGNRRGATALREALSAYTPEPAFTRGELEKRFLALCRTIGVPTPRTNNATNGDEIDFTWPDRRLMVETDSHRHHGTRAAFERDRRRDQQLTAAGWRVVRFTWRQVDEAPAEVAATLRSLLAT